MDEDEAGRYQWQVITKGQVMDMSITGWEGRATGGRGGGVAFQEGTHKLSYSCVLGKEEARKSGQP
jgi:hypothetical protein